MGFFSDLRNAAVSIHTKRQSRSYRKLRSDTQKAKLEREKLRMIHQAKKEKARTRQGAKRLRGTRMPKLIGNLSEFAKGIPNEAELNKALFGAPSPKRSKSDDDIARDILK